MHYLFFACTVPAVISVVFCWLVVSHDMYHIITLYLHPTANIRFLHYIILSYVTRLGALSIDENKENMGMFRRSRRVLISRQQSRATSKRVGIITKSNC